MGRVRLSMKRLESSSNRQVTYCKRRSGILKKAHELSVLCDIDIILLMFPPSGKPSLFQGGPREDCVTVIDLRSCPISYLELTFGDRIGHEVYEVEWICETKGYFIGHLVFGKFPKLLASRFGHVKLEGLETLRKTLNKLDNDMSVQEFLDARYIVVLRFVFFNSVPIENNASFFQIRKAFSHFFFFCCSDMHLLPSQHYFGYGCGVVDNLKKKKKLVLTRIASCNHGLLIPDGVCTKELLNAVHVRKNTTHMHLLMNSEQDGQTNPRHQTNKIKHMPFPEAPNVLPQESVLNHINYLTFKLIDDRCIFVANSSRVLDSEKVDQARRVMLDDSVLDDLNSIACLRQQLSEQYSYTPNNNLDLLERKISAPQSNVNLKENWMEYEIQRHFSLPRSVDSINNSAADAIGDPNFDEKSYPQVI
ncbi:hypothetical protein P3S67_031078 [Capsicum chacoense]